jgi:hypothetical protein
MVVLFQVFINLTNNPTFELTLNFSKWLVLLNAQIVVSIMKT